VTDQEHERLTRESFEHQTELFEGEDAPFAIRARSATGWMDPLDAGMVVLDVACGAAHVSEQIAPHVRQVVGIDVTPALLAMGAERLAAAGIGNVLLQTANVAALPFVDASFDLVVCRTAVHHFPDQPRALREMRRVCRPDGRVVVLDLVAPDASLQGRFDDIHRRLDPSHVHALLEDELTELVAANVGAVLRVDRAETLRLPIEVIMTDMADRDAVLGALHAELDGGLPTGLDPAMTDGAINVAFRLLTVEARPAAA
jgi:SAM-dependent methyltransferase